MTEFTAETIEHKTPASLVGSTLSCRAAMAVPGRQTRKPTRALQASPPLAGSTRRRRRCSLRRPARRRRSEHLGSRRCGVRIDDRHGRSAVVDEQLFASMMHLAHAALLIISSFTTVKAVARYTVFACALVAPSSPMA